MPELPEVESVRRQLVPALTGRRVVAVWFDPHPAARLGGLDLLPGRRVEDVARRGKFLLCPLGAPDAGGDGCDQPLELILHLGMTGSLRVLPSTDPPPAHVRVRLDLDDAHTLWFADARRFGRASVVPAGDYARDVPMLAVLGPEPLSDDFDADRFAAALARSRSGVKALLLGQRLVAGVGNIYADESLWRARIHPASRRVGRERARALHAAIRDVLAEAIEREGTTFRDYRLVNGESGRHLPHLDAYGRAGQPCRRCGTTMRRSVVAQRGTVHCPRCQRA